MKFASEEFGLRIKSDWVSSSHNFYRPLSWPPEPDWAVSEDRDGTVLSRWGDSHWNLSPWEGRSVKLDFGDGHKGSHPQHIDLINAKLLRLLTTWRIWGPRGVVSTNTLLANFFRPVRKIISHCSRNGIVCSDLMRFPKLVEQIPSFLGSSEYGKVISELQRLWDARDVIGFTIIDEEGLRRLATAQPDYEQKQTAYIPPRIWAYQLQRLRSCLDDFLVHQQSIIDCYTFCIDAYEHNYGSLQEALTPTETFSNHLKPFGTLRKSNQGVRTGRRYYGHFDLTAERFGIKTVLDKWVGSQKSGLEVSHMSVYLSLLQSAGLAYITNFTLQRINEAASLRTDCLLWEADEKLGRIAIICGETTKTDLDTDARWPTSPSVEVAVKVMTCIARLRMRCYLAHAEMRLNDTERANPYLLGRAIEPWSGGLGKVQPYAVRPAPMSYKELCRRYPLLLDSEQLRITEDDLRLARMLTPDLSAERGFAVGHIWPLAWHQLRRTGAVNMFASGLLSDTSMQFQMKHASRLMPLYYGRGYSKLRLNGEVEYVVRGAMYEAMAHKLHSAMSDRFISPHGPYRKQAIAINLVSDKDLKYLAAAASRGQTVFREIRLGACTKRGTCSYGGIESVARCAGGDGDAPCADVLYDRERAPEVERELTVIDNEITSAPAGSPRQTALLAERNGLENFLNAVAN